MEELGDVEIALIVTAGALVVLTVVLCVGSCITHERLVKEVKEGVDSGKYALKNASEEIVQGGNLEAIHVQPSGGSTMVPVVLLHGGQHARWFYRGLQEELKEAGFESYAPSLRSSKFKTTASHSRDYMDFLKALNLEKAILVGHSQGGLITQRMLIDNAKNGEGLEPSAVVYLGALAYGSSGLFRELMIHLNCQLGLWNILLLTINGRISTQNAIWKSFASKGLEQTDVTGVMISKREYCRLSLSTPPEGFIPLLPNLFISKVNKKNPAPKLNCPVLVVHFELDNTILISNARHIAKLYEGEFMQVDGMGHCFLEPNWRSQFGKPFIDWITNAA